MKLCTEIITSSDNTDTIKLYDAAKEVYEKLAVLKYIEEKLSDIEIDVSKNVLAAKFEMMANAVMNENRLVPESSPHEEDIITPGIETIKDMVSEMPTSEEVERIFTDFVAKTEALKKDKEWVSPDTGSKNGNESKFKSLNDAFTPKDLSFGLNDRLAFIKHLFNGNADSFDKAVSHLNTVDTEERSLAFLTKLIKPEYNDWKDKEEYEKRFIAIIQRRFA